ncbi:MAG: SUMF1/EgtB/PvdO family nonheme iron enzyme, partial [Anaerolineae bacterium]|nr:SUMF1/EgtB/PvdO family nonheme iron enzyme [Anaerolineae bacterium]
FYKDYRAIESDWKHLGRSPLLNMRFPIGAFRFKIQKEGFETVETVLATPETASGPIDSVNVVLDKEGSLPPGMARIPPAKRLVEIAGLVWQAVDILKEKVQAPEYYIDKYEVTNEQYKKFVDAGGYQTRDYWKHEFIKHSETISWNEAISAFRDNTGQPGPSTWEGGTYPVEKGNHPVSGVSWYEAAAYAEFAKKSIPTVYHWSGAARESDDAGVFVPFSNYRGKGTAPVGSHPGIGLYGLYDIAGNVKEWCWNATDDSGNFRYILGGAWSEGSYSSHYPDARSPWDRSPENGFRCVRYPFGKETVPETVFRPTKIINRDPRSFVPVSNEVFQAYKKNLYSYDRTDLNAVVESVDDSSALWRREKITFDAAYGNERVIAYLFLPKGVEPPYQTVVYFPTGIARRSWPSENIGREQGRHDYFWEFIVLSGRAVMYPVYKGSYERQIVGGTPLMGSEPRAYVDWQIQLAKDFRKSIDYLETREDIDHEKFAYYGVSWGANVGPINLGLQNRIKVGIFLIPGFYGNVTIPEIDPINFAPHVKIPLLLLNGEHDYWYPEDVSQKPFFDLVGTPGRDKDYRAYPGGHGMWGLFGHEVRKDILEWLDRYLGPVQKPVDKKQA